CYDAAIAVEGPEVVAAFYDKATLLNQLGRREEAVAHYNMVNQLEPEFAEAWHEKAHILEELGRNEEAEECLKEYKLISSQSGGCCAR
ncbi:MAG: tetratricopeptide repeat protein, partial [Planctomycetota bacterium]